MATRGRYSSGRGAHRHSSALANESSRSRPLSSSTPQYSTTSLPPPSSTHTEVPTSSAPSSFTPPHSTSHTEVPTSSTPSSTTRVSTASNKKLKIQVERGSIVPSHKCSSVLRKKFEGFTEYGGTSWKKVTAETKRIYYEEFCKQCEWDSIFDGEIPHLYHVKAANVYSHMINDWKRRYYRKDKKPECLLDDIWENFLEYWGRPEVVQKSQQNRKNRLSEPCGEGTGISKHKGGSRSAQDHALEIDEVQEKVAAVTQSVEGSSESQPIDMSKLFVEVVGVQKGRIFGIGNIGKTYNSSSSRSSASSSMAEPEITRRINEMVEARVQERLGAKVEEVRAEIQRQVEQQVEQKMEKKMEEMMRNMMQDRVNSPGLNSIAPTEGEDQNDIDMD